MGITTALELGLKITGDASSAVTETKRTEEALKGVGKAARDTGSEVDKAAKSLTTLAQAGLGLYAVKQAFEGLAQLGKITDEFATVASRLSLVTASSTALTQAQQRLFQIAQQSRTSYSALGETYARMANATKDLGISQSRLLAVTETVSKAMTIGGGSAESMRAALVQLSQGLASGTLRGEELNSVLEQAPRLAQAIAEGMGTSVGQLRKLGEAGKITAGQIVEALEKAAPTVAQEFQKITPTISSSFTALRDSFGNFVAELDKGTGTSASLASGMLKLADSLTSMASVAKDAGATLKPVIDVAAWTAFGLAAGGALSTVIGWVTKLKGLTLNPITIAITLGAAAASTAVEGYEAWRNTIGGAEQYKKSWETVLAKVREGISRIETDLKKTESGDLRAHLLKGLDSARDAEAAAIRKIAEAEQALYEVRMKNRDVPERQLQLEMMRKQDIQYFNDQAAAENASIEAVKAATAAYAEATKGVKTRDTIEREYQADLKKSQDAYMALAQAMVAAGSSQERMMEIARQQDEVEKQLAADRDKSIKALSANPFRDGAMQAATQALAESFAELDNGSQKMTASQKKLLDLQTDPKWATISARDKQQITDELTLAAMNERLAVSREKELEILLKRAAMFDDESAARQQEMKDYLAKLGTERETNQLLEVRLSTIGMEETQAARLNTIAKAMVDIRKAEKNEDYVIAGILRERLNLELGILDATKETADAKKVSEFLLENEKRWLSDSVKAAEQLQSTITDALMRAFESGKDAAKSLRDTVVNMFKTLVLRPTIQAIVAGTLGGGFAGAAGASGFGGGGTGGLGIGNLLSTGSSALGLGGSLFGYGGIAGAFSGAGGMFGAGAIGNTFALSGVGQALGLSAVGLDAAGGVGLTALGATLGAAIPVVGAILAVLAMSGAFSSQGGPKTGGFAQLKGMNLAPFFTETQSSKDLAKLVNGAASSYENLVRGFGGTPGDFQFALGFDSDPSGTAPNRISAGASLNGVNILQLVAKDIGRDQAALEQTIADVTRDALKGAILASDIPQAVKDLLQPFEGTVEEFESYANKLVGVNALMKSTNVSLQQILGELDLSQMEHFTDAFGGVQQTLDSLTGYVSRFYSSQEQLTIATETMIGNFDALGVAMPKSKLEFRQMLEAIDLTSESGRTLYASLIALSPAFADFIDSVDAAAQTLFDNLGRLANLQGTSPIPVLQARMFNDVMRFAQGRDWALNTIESTGGPYGLANLLTQIAPADFANYSAEDQALILNIIDTRQQIDQLATSAEAATPSIFSVTEAIDALTESASNFREQLAGWLDSLMLDRHLSTLSPEQMLATAKTQYFDALRSGDASAITSTGNTYLRLGREMYGSASGYNAIFANVRETAGAVANGQSIESLIRDGVVVQTQIRDGVQAVVGAVQQLGSQFSSWQFGPPTTTASN